MNFDYPAILLTGQGDDQIDQNASDAGISDFIDKNVLSSVMLERSIRYAIKQNSLLLELKAANKQLSDLEAFRAHVFDVAYESLGKPVSRIRRSIEGLKVELGPLINSRHSHQLDAPLAECDKIEEYLSQFSRARSTCAL